MKHERKARGSCFLRLVTLMVVVLTSLNVFSQEKVITGTVKGEDDLAIPGVTVFIQGTTVGTVSDMDGNFSLTIKNATEPVVVFSFVGMKTQEIPLGTQSKLDVVMLDDVNEVDEVVVMGYGAQKRISVTGAVNTIKAEDLATGASASVATSLTGRMPGTVIVQSNGQAGSGASVIRIRGAESNPLVLVDGVERSFQDLDPDEIESISILKDASATAVYGVRGGSGAIIVTTKRGKDGPAKVTLTTEFGLIEQGKILSTLNAYDYARLHNEARTNDGETLRYSEEDIELFRTGEDPIYHPNNDWFQDLTNQYGDRQRYTLKIAGGHQKLRYFTSIGYMKERDIYKDFDLSYDDESKYERYNIRANLDVDLSTSTVLSVNIGGQFANRNQVNVNYGTVTTQMFKTPADALVFYEGKMIRTNPDVVNATPLQLLYDNGYQDKYSNKLQLSGILKQNLEFVTKGLSFDATFSYDHGYNNNFTASKNIPIYDFVDPSNPDVNNLQREGTETVLGQSRSTGTEKKRINARLKLDYKRTFGKHHVSGLVVFTANEQSYFTKSEDSPIYVPRRYMELASRLSYNYNDKYFVEFNGGGTGSETFAPGDTRFGFFPAISAGYAVSNESFFPKNDVLTFLKLRGSYGAVGNDKGIGRFGYYDTYKIYGGGGYLFGELPEGQGQAILDQIGNPDITWATNYQKNFAVETRWFDGKLKFDVDVFETERKDILINQNNIAGIIGTPNTPPANLGEQKIWGHELQASYALKAGDFDLNIFANYSYADKEVVFKDEVPKDYPWQTETGKHPKSINGMVFDGFYSQEDIDYLVSNNWVGDENVVASGYVGQNLQAGDLKFKDLNGDGVTDGIDLKVFENLSVPKTSYGFGTNFGYKGWSLDIFMQGVQDVTYNISGFIREPFIDGIGNGSDIILGRWNAERAEAGEEITFPRLASSGKHSHNYVNSDFWFRDASYIRLKNVELAYKWKREKLKRFGVSSVRMYLSGTNLYTWTDLDFVDPESKSGSNAPIGPNKVYTFGLNVSF